MELVFKLGRSSLLLILVFCLTLTGCEESTNFRAPADRGVKFEELNQSETPRELAVGVVWSVGDGKFVEGARLAVEEINAKKEGEEFRYRLVVVNENKYLAQAGFDRLSEGRYRNASQRLAKRLAKEFSLDPDIVAVIGHSDKYNTALPAALSYQDNGILFLSSASTDTQMAQLDSPLTFQLSSPDNQLAEQMADYIISRRFKNMLVLFSRDRKSENFVEFLQKSIQRSSTSVVIHQQSVPNRYLRGGEWSDFDTTSIIAGLTKAANEKKIDSVLIVSDMTISNTLIKGSKDFGFKLPFIVMPATSTERFISDVGESGVGTVMPASVDQSTPHFKQFAKRFVKYTEGTYPDASAALGYDSVYLLNEAMEKASSSKPLHLSLTLRYTMPPWTGASGTFGFLENGANNHRKYFFTRLVRTDSGELQFRPEDKAKEGG
jgi:branched-chain amino acid transport system substrate-binding protein|tara:strand:- start:336 stop:1640 length:1305 start_codon:yes stop_codon:yes gene_type:complete